MIHVRMDNDLKDRATEALAAMGLSTADAVRLLFHRIATDQAFPLELKVPNAETRAAMEEADEFFKNGSTPRFDKAEDMFTELEEESKALREAGKPKS
ncbi:type II toxin-antitoxin system RelB/DinJ family antitoxin [Croceicoccus gelatinilyticus]|uniref:type II toxin-antitoxin system RelB/DinJ family antitoxin n=1 Tax=Croceicoccus gelatinilyticus TaxID=2835536 RepID=UPI001BCE7AF1|nr:type II toxin-antitoxin system RelB/DinJ family antitoxin [Croceicoccus gelatinilyticus]MBS7671232.1 type II toxin-antitoxin system RelB/DinJ family antitoxin [Croceicoccus gelatinilyticus]